MGEIFGVEGGVVGAFEFDWGDRTVGGEFKSTDGKGPLSPLGLSVYPVEGQSGAVGLGVEHPSGQDHQYGEADDHQEISL